MDGAELTELTVSRPTLEDAYLQLIGLTVMDIDRVASAAPPRTPADRSRGTHSHRRCVSACRESSPS